MKPQLIFLGCWPPPYGGISSHLHQLLPPIVKAGYQVDVLSFHSESKETHKEENGVRISFFSPKAYFKKRFFEVLLRLLPYAVHLSRATYKNLILGATLSLKIEEIVSKGNYVLLFTYDNDKLFLNPFIRSKELRAVFNTIYADFYLFPEKYNPHRRFLRLCIARSTKLLSCSKYCLNSLRLFTDKSFPTEVIYNNVDPVRFSPKVSGERVRYSFGIKEGQIVLMTMARVSASMGINFILEVAPSLFRRFPDLIIFICGSKGDLSDDVVRVSSKYERMRYKFDIAEEEKPEFFAACDIFSAPTSEVHACMGIANIEAMMTGKPVVSSMSGGHPETIDNGKSGFLVPFVDGKISLSSYLHSVQLLYEDSNMRSKMGINGRNRAELIFSNERIVQKHLELIESALPGSESAMLAEDYRDKC